MYYCFICSSISSVRTDEALPRLNIASRPARTDEALPRLNIASSQPYTETT